jgi:hypothetical protein
MRDKLLLLWIIALAVFAVVIAVALGPNLAIGLELLQGLIPAFGLGYYRHQNDDSQDMTAFGWVVVLAVGLGMMFFFACFGTQ